MKSISASIIAAGGLVAFNTAASIHHDAFQILGVAVSALIGVVGFVAWIVTMVKRGE